MIQRECSRKLGAGEEEALVKSQHLAPLCLVIKATSKRWKEK